MTAVIRPMVAFSLLSVLVVARAQWQCPDAWRELYFDGQTQTEISIQSTTDDAGNKKKTLTIKPTWPGNQTWVVKAKLDPQSCKALVDFNVPGKPAPPPVKLQAAMWWFGMAGLGPEWQVPISQWEFTDPSGTLAPKNVPLSRWVAQPADPMNRTGPSIASGPCPSFSKTVVFADLANGDRKEVSLDNESMTIRPCGNNQTWVVKTKINKDESKPAAWCNANVDFNVPGKPAPRLAILATFWRTFEANLQPGVLQPSVFHNEIHFLDPGGRQPKGKYGQWVEIIGESPGCPAPSPPRGPECFHTVKKDCDSKSECQWCIKDQGPHGAPFGTCQPSQVPCPLHEEHNLVV
jgi:hypothetical protein